MSTDAGQDRILNPQGKDPILKVPWQPLAYTEEIRSRVSEYAEKYVNSRDVTGKFIKIREDLEDFYKKVLSELSDMEHDWVDELNDDTDTDDFEGNEVSTGRVVGVVIGTSPIWVPLLAAGIALTVAFTGVTIGLSPILLPIMSFLGREKRKKELIAEEFANCKSTIRSTVCNQLEAGVEIVLTKMINKVMELILRRVEALQKMTEQLSKSRENILANQDMLSNLAQTVELMIENAKKIQDI